jgi:hypothetical protein
MNHDSDNLRLLAIFQYVVAGLAVFFSFFPILYSAMGALMLYAAYHPGPNNKQPPPAVLGWFFAMLGALFFFTGLVIAICILIAGRSLARQRRYWFAFIVACIECLFISFSTILGVFTIIVLSREPVKALFSPRI